MAGLQPSHGFLPQGTQLNGIYEIDAPLASGGMGEVYRGHEIQSGDPVAIKVVKADMADNEAALALFRREASALNRLHHEAIVRYFVFSLEPVLQRHYLAMELVEGVSLSDMLKRGPLPVEDVHALQKRVASGLHAAHMRGIVHRDMSPDNVIVPANDIAQARIIDFGIARSTNIGDGTVIGSGFAGKYNYVSPEQLGLFGGDVTGKSDIYSLGLVLANCLRGRPFDMGGSQFDVIEKRRTVPDLSEIDPRIRPLIERMLRPDPAERPADMAEVAAWALAAPSRGARKAVVRDGAQPRAGSAGSGRKVAVAVIGLALAGAAGFVAWLQLAEGPPAQPVPQASLQTPSLGQRPLLPSAPPSAPATTPAEPVAEPPPAAPGRPAYAAEDVIASLEPHAEPAAPPPVDAAPPREEAPSASGTAVSGSREEAAPPPRAETPPRAEALPREEAPPRAEIPPAAKPPPAAEPPSAGPQQSAPAAQPAPEPQTALAPPVQVPVPPPAAVAPDPMARAARYIRDYKGGDCTFVTPSLVTAKATIVQGYGVDVKPFEAFDAAFKSANGWEAQIEVRLITQAQCAALPFLSALNSNGELEPQLEVVNDSIRSGDTLQGTVDTGDPYVQMMIVDDDGNAHDVTSQLKEAGGRHSFAMRLSRPGGSGTLPMLLIAVTSVEPIAALRRGGSAPVKDITAAALAEARTQKRLPGVALKYLKML